MISEEARCSDLVAISVMTTDWHGPMSRSMPICSNLFRFGIVLLGAGFFCMILPLRRLRCVTFTRGYPGRRMNLRIFLSAWHDSFLHCNCAGHQCMNDI